MERKTLELAIYVTQEDIDKGYRVLSDKCPVARAVNRLGLGVAQVGPEDIEVSSYENNDKVIMRCSVDKQTGKFINDFDCEREVHPFSTVLQFECLY